MRRRHVIQKCMDIMHGYGFSNILVGRIVRSIGNN
jgi:hypothetical protein